MSVTYNAVVRDYNQAASSSIVGRLLLPDLKQVPSSWRIEFQGKVLQRTVDLNELMCSPQEPLQVWKPMKANSVIILSTMSMTTIELPFVSLDTTVDALKTKIRLIEGMKQEDQGLIWGGQSLEERNRTLKDYGIKYGDTIQLVRRVVRDNKAEIFNPPVGPFDVLIKTLTGRTIQVKASSEDTVDILKARIQDKEGIPPDQQRLVHAAWTLKDEILVRNYGIGNGSILHLVLNLRGGGRFPKMSTVDLEAQQIAGHSGGYSDYSWNGYTVGLNLLGVCPKMTCISNQLKDRIVVNAKFGVIKMTPGKDKFPCPACPESAHYKRENRAMFCPQNFLVSSARSLFRFKKTGVKSRRCSSGLLCNEMHECVFVNGNEHDK